MTSADDPAAKKPRLDVPAIGVPNAPPSSSAILTPADEVVTFRLLTACEPDALRKEIDEGGAEFNGEFFHQHFNVEGREEQIRGYDGLQIDVWVSARTLHMWLDIKFKKRKAGADKLEKIFGEFAPPGGFIHTKDDFVNAVQKASESMPDLTAAGTVVASLDVAAGDSAINIVRYNLKTADAAVKAIHARMEPLMMFFIDGASSVDADDDMWELLLAVKPVPSGGSIVLGLQTVYKFWAFPDMHRLRLSQVLVLPPYQGVGIGKQMLQVAYSMASELQCKDLTVEDPSPNLQCVREKLECEMMATVPWISEQAHKCAEAAMSKMELSTSSSSISGSVSSNPCRPPPSFFSRVTKELKITRKEVVIVWEGLMYCQAGLKESSSGTEALEQMICARLEAAHFAHCGADAETKQVIDTNKERNFIMWRCGRAKAAADAAFSSAPDVSTTSKEKEEEEEEEKPIGEAIADALIQSMKTSSTDAGGAPREADGAAVASGRLSVTTMSAAEKKEKLDELLTERMGALDTLKRLVRKGAVSA